jgi:hypothetical protein
MKGGRMNRRIFLVAVSAFALSACAAARSAKVESDSTTSYSINVYNARNSPVVVSYEGDASSRELGTVAAGDTQRFVVITGTSAITIHARSSAGSPLSSQMITLSRANPVSVTIR